MAWKKLIAGIVFAALCLLMVLFLAGLVQSLLISGTEFIDGLGALVMDDTEYTDELYETQWIDPNERLGVAIGTEEIEQIPEPTPEPEELVEIPIEETPEELAQEYRANH